MPRQKYYKVSIFSSNQSFSIESDKISRENCQLITEIMFCRTVFCRIISILGSAFAGYRKFRQKQFYHYPFIYSITDLPEEGAGEAAAWSEASLSPSEHCSTSTSTSSSGTGERQLDAGELSDAGELCLDTEPVGKGNYWFKLINGNNMESNFRHAERLLCKFVE